MKKFLSCLLAVIMCISVFPITAFARDYELATSVTTKELLSYGKGFDASSYMIATLSADYKNEELSAALNLRDNLIARNEKFNVELKSDKSPDLFFDIVNTIILLATSEELADSPVAGDYLKWQVEQYGCDAKIKINGDYAYNISFTVKYYTTAKQEQQVNKKIDSLMPSLVNNNDSEYTKIKKIYDYICDNVEYDYENLDNDSYKLKYTAYAALLNHTSVCQGYTNLFYRLAREAGLNARIVTSTTHAWNIVEIDGKYYNIDATWDSAVRQSGMEYQWFLKNMKNFEHAEHVREDMYDALFDKLHPMSATDYKVAEPHKHTQKTVNEKSATCGADGYTGDIICSTCNALIKTGSVIPATKNHTWDNGKVTKTATCSATGVKTYTCTVCKETKTETIAKTNHKAVTDKAVAPTCTTAGKTEGSHCSVCNTVITEQKSIAPTGHTTKWQTKNGVIVKNCTVCNKEISKLQFTDLNSYEYYADYIEYTSVNNKFITGTNPPERTLFSPTTPITRAMFVTILYRMAGEPYSNNRNPYKTSPFTDITNTSVYYYDAACWALKNGITTQKTFKPLDNVNREQTASFLFRYAQSNGKISDTKYKSVNLKSYPDYNTVSSWAVEALQWANYNGMITGTQQGYINPQGATQRIHATKILYGFGKTCNIGNF